MAMFENYKDYFYEGTEVLKNKLNIRDERDLNDKERSLVSLRVSQITESPVKGEFDFEHLKKINEYLFQDLYEWAGQLRKCEMSKSDIFCLYSNLEYFANSIFSRLKDDNYFMDLTESEKITKLVDLFGDINALHPFREGNGRTQREFIEELAKVNGINLDLTHISRENMIEASHRSINGDNGELFELFYGCSKPVSKEMQIYYICNYCEPKLAKRMIDTVMKFKKIR